VCWERRRNRRPNDETYAKKALFRIPIHLKCTCFSSCTVPAVEDAGAARFSRQMIQKRNIPDNTDAIVFFVPLRSENPSVVEIAIYT
jgi:hypothetical protein